MHVAVLPKLDRNREYAEYVAQLLNCDRKGVLVEVDDRDELFERKLWEVEMRKVPFVLVVGDLEQEEGTVLMRMHYREENAFTDFQCISLQIVSDQVAPLLQTASNVEAAQRSIQEFIERWGRALGMQPAI